MSTTSRYQLADALGLKLYVPDDWQKAASGNAWPRLDMGFFRERLELKVWADWRVDKEDRIMLLIAGPGDFGLMITNAEGDHPVLALLDRSKLPKRGKNLFDVCVKFTDAIAAVRPGVILTFEYDVIGKWQEVVDL